MIVEALLIARKGVTLGSLRCVVKSESKKRMYFFPASEKTTIDRIWRIQCTVPAELREQITLTDDILISVVDYEDYLDKKRRFGQDNLILQFHKPLIFDNQYVSKKRAVAHCVHTIRGVDAISLKRLTEWLLIQREFGYAHIKLYFLDAHAVDRIDVQELLQTSNADFRVDLVKYPTSVDDNCGWMQNVSTTIYSECESLVTDRIRRVNSMQHIHEKLCTNDCYFKLRHSYAYVTNFDFDELLFPRQMKVDEYAPFFDDVNNSSSCLQRRTPTVKHNIYEYAERLITKYERESKPVRVAAMHFDHFLAIPTKSRSGKHELDVLDMNEHGEIRLRLNGRLVTATINTNEDVASVLTYKRVVALTQCLLNRTRISSFDLLWTSPFMLRVEGRYGKTLFATDYTEMLNQHGPHAMAPNSQLKFVPLEDGFSSHYRKSSFVDTLINFPLTWCNMRFELEFFLILVEMDEGRRSSKIFNSTDQSYLI